MIMYESYISLLIFYIVQFMNRNTLSIWIRWMTSQPHNYDPSTVTVSAGNDQFDMVIVLYLVVVPEDISASKG